MEKGQLWRQYIIGCVANIAGVAVGYSVGWTAPVNLILTDENLTPLPIVLTPDQLSWIGALPGFGALIGPFLGGFAASTVGRKWSLLISSVPLFVGSVLIAVATNVYFIYVGRTLGGVATGIIFTISSVYCVEIATVEARGALGAFFQTFLTLGTLIAYGIGPFTSYYVTAYVSVVIVVIFAVAFFFMPESPIYYLIKDDRKSAAAALATIRGRTLKGVENELDVLAADVDESKNATGKFTDIFRGKNFKAFYIINLLMYFQQFAGISAVLMYMTEIFEAANTNLDPAYSTLIVGVVQFLASMVTQLVVDKLGRRPLLLVSSAGSGIALGFLGIYFFLAESDSPIAESLEFLPLASLIVYMVMFCLGLGAIPWCMMGELLPIEVKSIAAPIATSGYWVYYFLIARYFGVVAEAAGMYVVFWIFAVKCAASFLFTLFAVPETKDKTYQEIQDLLATRKKRKRYCGSSNNNNAHANL